MHFSEKWIWLPRAKYPERQLSRVTNFRGNKPWYRYTVAEFKKEYKFEKKVDKLHLRFSGDAGFILYLNGELLATGPAGVGGDALRDISVRPNYYSTELEVSPMSDKLSFFSRVKIPPTDLCDYSKGRGGFMLTGHVTFEDGTRAVIMTDETWLVRYNGAFVSPTCYDGRITPDEYVNAEEVVNIWLTETSPLPPRTETEVFPSDCTVTLLPHETKNVYMELDRIYAGFAKFSVNCDGCVKIHTECRETDENEPYTEELVFDKNGEYRSFKLHSAGNFNITAENLSDAECKLTVSFLVTHHPVTTEAAVVTSDEGINRILDVCRHTLKMCRQTIHLDSPKHCEPLMCTGDYYVETLMTLFSFGDMSLAEFDIIRTAELFRQNDGRIFHTTYSLIWVMWLYDVYMITGNVDLLFKCEDALLLLLARFETYLGDTGLIEYPPDYMFVDWIYVDGYSMHHPPKALGQSCLNMYYFAALDNAERIFRTIGETAMADDCAAKREKLRGAINSMLFDKERGMYFEGLNTKTPEHLLDSYSMPQNTDKRYYLKQSNILATAFGVCDGETGCGIVRKIMSGECPGDFQPFFAHFLFEAIFRHGLCGEYTLTLADRWRRPVEDCPKGLAEGFVTPEPGYKFDHSHAWGGSPLYSIPKAVTGLEILEAGMKKISLSPSLLSFERAYVELPTPYGMVKIQLEKGKVPVISTPDGIEVITEGIEEV